VDINGTNRTNLTQSNSLNYSPTWSPDGSQIAFASNRDGNGQIYQKDQDGRNVKQLTNTKSDNTNPRWSPDGIHIAFEYHDIPNNRNAQIYSMNVDGSGLVNISNNIFHNYSPEWSPDSKQIAFIANDGKNAKIGLADLINKTNRILDVTTDANGLSWSNDGKHIAFETRIDIKHTIYTITSDGKEINQLSDNNVSDFQPEWSPIGSNILFWRDVDRNLDIYIMNMDGTNVRNLSQNAAQDAGGVWSTARLHVAFGTTRDRNHLTLYVMDSTGENPHKIADRVLNFSYAWQPCLISRSK